MGVKGDPIDSKDYPSKTGASLEVKPQKSEYKAKLNFDISTPDMSGVRLWENVSQRYNYNTRRNFLLISFNLA